MSEENIFIEKSHKPTELDLKKRYGSRYNYWIDLTKFVASNFGQTTSEWKHYGAKSGWVQKLFLKKRNLLFFIPYKNYFSIGMVFGDKAAAEILNSDLPEDIISEIKKAKKYAEGRGLRIKVKDKKSADNLKKLLRIKIIN
jgi:hypothetical protein